MFRPLTRKKNLRRRNVATIVYLTLILPAQLSTVSEALGAVTQTTRKPVLVRDEVNKPKPEEPEVRERNPERAREEAEIGDFYMKRDNYAAAEARYREAVAFDPQWTEAYVKLAKVLGKLGRYEEAVQVCQDYLQAHPDAKEAKKVQDLMEDLKEEMAKAERAN